MIWTAWFLLIFAFYLISHCSVPFSSDVSLLPFFSYHNQPDWISLSSHLDYGSGLYQSGYSQGNRNHSKYLQEGAVNTGLWIFKSQKSWEIKGEQWGHPEISKGQKDREVLQAPKGQNQRRSWNHSGPTFGKLELRGKHTAAHSRLLLAPPTGQKQGWEMSLQRLNPLPGGEQERETRNRSERKKAKSQLIS